MTERELFIINTIMLAFNVTMVVIQIVIGACIDDTEIKKNEEDTNDE